MTEKRRPMAEQYSRVGMATAGLSPTDRVAKVADVCDGVVAMTTGKCSPAIGPPTRKRKRAEIQFCYRQYSFYWPGVRLARCLRDLGVSVSEIYEVKWLVSLYIPFLQFGELREWQLVRKIRILLNLTVSIRVYFFNTVLKTDKSLRGYRPWYRDIVD